MNQISILTVTLPDIGEGVVEGEVIAWIKQEGDLVSQDEPVVVVMTDKATVELPAPKPGKIIKHYFPVGGIAIKDRPLYDIELVEKHTSHSSSEGLSKEESVSHKVLASPKTRFEAKEQGINLSQITGTGKEGRITKQDLTCLLKPTQHVQPTHLNKLEGDQELPFVGIKYKMAEKMTQALREIPHFSFFEQADVSRLVQFKDKLMKEAEEQNIHLTFAPFFIKALSLTAKQFPLINASLDMVHKVIIQHQVQNVGVAMAAQYGLIVPVIKDVHKMNLKELIYAYDDLKKRAFDNKLHSHDLKDSTITLSNFGSLPGASLGGTPIISPPEVAICGVARILKTPVVINNEIVIRDRMNVSFSFDHRLIDGQLASQASSYFCNLLENPHTLI